MDSQECGPKKRRWPKMFNWFSLCLIVAFAGVAIILAKTEKTSAPADKPAVAEMVEVEPPQQPSVGLMSALRTLNSGNDPFSMPTYAKLEAMNAKLVDVDFTADISGLTDKDKKFLLAVMEAADAIDDIFYQQSSPDGLALRQACGGASDILPPYDRSFCRYLLISHGRFDRLDHDKDGDAKAFVSFRPGDAVKPKGANYYPSDMTKEMLEQLMGQMTPAGREAFASPYTRVVYTNGQLEGSSGQLAGQYWAEPFSDAYRAEIVRASNALRKAAEYADTASMRTFLLSRADAFRTNDYRQSDADWVRAQDSKFEVVIGPYEVYEDGLMNTKAAFEAIILVKDDKTAQWLRGAEDYMPDMENELPVPEQYKGYQRRAAPAPAIIAREIYAAGEAASGIHLAAFNLPNDDTVRRGVGYKNVMVVNSMEAKFRVGHLPIAAIVLEPHQAGGVTWDAYLWFVQLHERAHGMGPSQVRLPDGRMGEMAAALNELYSAIEEAKADIIAFRLVRRLTEKGYLPAKMYGEVTAVALEGFFRAVRFGLGEAHGRGELLIYNYLKEWGAYVWEKSPGGKMGQSYVEPSRFYKGVDALAAELLAIEAAGDYARAKALLDRYARTDALPPEVQSMFERLKDVPTDIRPVYSTAKQLRREMAALPHPDSRGGAATKLQQ